MPVHRTHLSDLGVIYTRAQEPFSIDELVDETWADLRKGVPNRVRDIPVILDFRGVNLVQHPTAAFQALVRERRALMPKIGSGPCAYVAGDDGSFGMLRLYTTYCELEGVRTLENTCLTFDIKEAVTWTLAQMGTDAPETVRDLDRRIGTLIGEVSTA